MDRRYLLIALTAFALQGCVALAAVPLAASGGLLVGNAVFGERTRQAIAEGTDIEPEAIDFTAYAEYTLLDASELPAPAPTLPTGGPVAELHLFATRTLGEEAEQYSALLENPASLSATRSRCEAEVPAVLFDLDPAEGLVALDAGTMPDPGLVAVLEDLRRRNVAIAWMTDREPTEAGRIRQRLLATRLDPTGRDPLFVQRYPGETKQERRHALLETHCLIAIAGDERADFDDVYIYLLDQTAAQPLEAMIGAGWFLIPTPLD